MAFISLSKRTYIIVFIVALLLGSIGYYVATTFLSQTSISSTRPVGIAGNEIMYPSDLNAQAGNISIFRNETALWEAAVQQSLALQYAQEIGFLVLDEEFFNSPEKDQQLRKIKHIQISDRMNDTLRLSNFTMYTMYYSLPMESSEEERSVKRSETEKLLREYIDVYRKNPAMLRNVTARAAALSPDNADRPLSLNVTEHNPFLPSIYSPYYGFLNNPKKGDISQAYYTSVMNMDNQFHEGVVILEVTEVTESSQNKMQEYFGTYTESANVERYEN